MSYVVRQVAFVAALASVGYGLYRIDSPIVFIIAGVFTLLIITISNETNKVQDRADKEGT